MAYHIGRNTPVTLVGLDNQKVTAYTKETGSVDCEKGTARQYGGVKKDSKLAELHFTLIADILAHLTKGSSPNDIKLRERRVAEANLIYHYVGLPEINYGVPTGKYAKELLGRAAEKRGLISLMSSTLNAFKNKSTNLVAGGDVKIIYQNKNVDPTGQILQERSKDVMRYAGALAGIKVLSITSLYRPPEKQGGTMAENFHGGNRIHYGPAGTAVNNVYVADAKKNPGPKEGYVTDERFKSYTKAAMIKKCKDLCANGEIVSRHCWDYTKVQAIDISSKQLMAQFKYSEDDVIRLGSVFRQLKEQGILKNYIAPDGLGNPGAKTGEPAFHIEVWTSGKGSEISIPLAKSDPSAMSPTDKDQSALMNNPNFASVTALDAVFTKDNVDKKNNERG